MTKKELLAIKSEGNKLTKKVVNVILDQGDTEEMESFIKDVLQHGCQSGIVRELIYYKDTTEFYSKYKKEISALLNETLSETGCDSPAELFGNKWDEEDPLAIEDHNKNLLAWFGFEETCRQIANDLGIDY